MRTEDMMEYDFIIQATVAIQKVRTVHTHMQLNYTLNVLV